MNSQTNPDPEIREYLNFHMWGFFRYKESACVVYFAPVQGGSRKTRSVRTDLIRKCNTGRTVSAKFTSVRICIIALFKYYNISL